jgi:hypothetical protein
LLEKQPEWNARTLVQYEMSGTEIIPGTKSAAGIAEILT